MSQTIKLNGQTYENISEILLPNEAGESIKFILPDGTMKITENGTYDISNYANVLVNASFPAGTIEITENGTYDITNYKLVKVNIPTEERAVKIDTNENTTIILEHNTEYRRNFINNLILKLPSFISNQFECQVCFTSSDTGANITIPKTIKLKGDDVLNGELIIKPNYRYNLLFWNDGVYMWCAVYAEPYVDPAKIYGLGTFEDPYLISTALQLKTLANEVNNGDNKKDKYYLLTNDIDLAEYNWIPIGYSENTTNKYGFSGIFNGNGHVIRNIYINSDTLQYAGLFGKYFDGVLMNLGMEGGKITTTANNSRAGALVGTAKDPQQLGYTNAIIVNSYARVPCQADLAAGLIGDANRRCQVLGCYQAALIKDGWAITADGDYFDVLYCCWDQQLTKDGVDMHVWEDPKFIDDNKGFKTNDFKENAVQYLTNAVTKIITNDSIPSYLKSSLCEWKNGPDGYPILIPREDIPIESPTLIPYTLTISKGIGVENINVTRHGTNDILNSGDTIYKGDILTVNATASSGYVLNDYQETISVFGDITINITATKIEEENEVYLISTPNDLITLANEVNNGDNKEGKYYAMTNDIDLTGIEWIPIGASLSTDNGGNKYGFSGIFDGCGHIIKNLTINSDSIQYAGLFGSYFDGILVNLGLEGGSITTTYPSSTTGAFARKMVSTTNDSTTKAIIANCYSQVPCSGTARTAGLVDSITHGGLLINCYQAASLPDTNAYAIKAEDKNTGDIQYCYWNSELASKGINGNTNLDLQTAGYSTSSFKQVVLNMLNAKVGIAENLIENNITLCDWIIESENNEYPRLKVKTI